MLGTILFGFLYAITETGRMLSPYIFLKGDIRDKYFSEKRKPLKNPEICRIVTEVQEKEDLLFDPLCNCCISIRYAKKRILILYS